MLLGRMAATRSYVACTITNAVAHQIAPNNLLSPFAWATESVSINILRRVVHQESNCKGRRTGACLQVRIMDICGKKVRGENKKKIVFFSILVTSTYGTYSYDHQDLRISTSQNENYWSKHPHQCNFSFNSPNWRPPNLVVIFMRTKNLKTISIQFLGGNYGLNYPDPFQIFTRSWHVTSKPSPQKNPAKHSRTSRFGKGYWAKMVEAWFMDKESEFHQILPRMIQVKKESRKNQKCIIISVFVVDSSFAAHGICTCVWIKIDMRTNQTTMECDFVSRFFMRKGLGTLGGPPRGWVGIQFQSICSKIRCVQYPSTLIKQTSVAVSIFTCPCKHTMKPLTNNKCKDFTQQRVQPSTYTKFQNS